MNRREHVYSDLPSFDSDTTRVRYARLASLALAMCYVVFLPGGRLGASLAVSSVAVAAVALNRETLATYLLLFGTGTCGAIAAAIGLPGVGGKVAGVIGLLLVASDREFLRFLGGLHRPILWMAWVGVVLTLWYFLGPKTEYCTGLLRGCLTSVPLAMVGYAYLLWKPSVSWWTLGQLAVLSSLVLVAVGAIFTPSQLPGHILHLGVFREKITDAAFRVSAHDLGLYASMGALMVLYAKPDKAIGRTDWMQVAVVLGLGGIVLGWTFHRTSIVGFAAAAALAPLVRPRFGKVYSAFALASLLVLLAILVLAATGDNSELLAQQLDTEKSIGARLNRSTNWNAAMHCIRQKPWIGHGLGGFYISGPTAAGGGTFAHSFFLGLLSELGIIGTSLILLPMIPLYWPVRGHISLAMRSACGGAIVPVLMPVFLMAMIGGNVVDHVAFLALLAVLVESWPKHHQ